MESLTLARATAAMCACVLFVATLAAAEDMNGPPARPGVFRNAQELRDYLKALNEYFAIVGRPRFGRSGKRSSLATLLRRWEYGLDGNGPLVSPSELEYPITYST